MSKKILFVLMPERYRDEEFYTPYNLLTEKDYIVDVAGLQKGDAFGVNNFKFTPNLLFTNLTFKDFNFYDALIIPGGPGSIEYLWKNEKLHDTIRYFNKNNKIVAAICYAVIALVYAGLLENKKATVHPSDEAKQIFADNNVIFQPDGTVTLIEEKIITSQGPAFAKEFGEAIIDLLEK
jgi:protease I